MKPVYFLLSQFTKYFFSQYQEQNVGFDFCPLYTLIARTTLPLRAQATLISSQPLATSSSHFDPKIKIVILHSHSSCHACHPALRPPRTEILNRTFAHLLIARSPLPSKNLKHPFTPSLLLSPYHSNSPATPTPRQQIRAHLTISHIFD